MLLFCKDIRIKPTVTNCGVPQAARDMPKRPSSRSTLGFMLVAASAESKHPPLTGADSRPKGSDGERRPRNAEASVRESFKSQRDGSSFCLWWAINSSRRHLSERNPASKLLVLSICWPAIRKSASAGGASRTPRGSALTAVASTCNGPISLGGSGRLWPRKARAEREQRGAFRLSFDFCLWRPRSLSGARAPLEAGSNAVLLPLSAPQLPQQMNLSADRIMLEAQEDDQA